jgi:hypothetical protein
MTPAELTHLIEKCLRADINAAEFAVLENQLRTDATARAEWRRAANLDTALSDWAQRDPMLQAWQPPPERPPAATRPTMWWWSGIAAAFLCLGFWSWIVRPAIPPGPIEQTAQGCAVFAQSAGAAWLGGLVGVRLGDTLKAGPLVLAKGLAQIEFFSGATLVVEGPAEFEIVSPWEVLLRYGKARVHAPPAARGFQVRTPGLKLVDLGTEFGVEVDRTAREARVAVFSGEVTAHPKDGAQLSLREGDGLQQRGGQLDRTSAAPTADFVNGIGLQDLSRRHAQSRFTAWAQASREQSRDSRLIAYYPFHDVGSWKRIVRNAALPANPAYDGGAVGVTTVPGRWREKNALEFKRPGDRVRLQIDGTYEALTFACWAKVDGLDRKYNALFLTDGYEPGEPHWQIYEDGRLMFSLMYPHSSGKRYNQIYYSPVVFDSANTGRWHHLAVTYDSRGGEVVQFVDGREISREISRWHESSRPVSIGPSELGNWGLPTRDHKFPIRNLNGSLDEFALYQAALSPGEIQQLYLVGKPE